VLEAADLIIEHKKSGVVKSAVSIEEAYKALQKPP
jgi:hypothetical protein